MKQPNIVIFLADEFRADRLGHLSDPSASFTPHLDQLVQEDGVSFGNHFCQNPVCTPSRCSLMSGWYPHVRGHRTMNYMLHEGEPFLLSILKKAGYYIWWGGKNDLIAPDVPEEEYLSFRNPRPKEGLPPNTHEDTSWRGRPENSRFFSFLAGAAAPTEPDGSRMDADLWDVREACRFLRESPHEEPFCLFLPISAPHPPYSAEQKWLDRLPKHATRRKEEPDWDRKPAILHAIKERQNLDGFTEADWNLLTDLYNASCMRVDDQVGQILSALKDAGVYDDTAFFFLSDHGDYTGDYGLVEKCQNTFEDCLTHTPMIMKPQADVRVRPGVRTGLTENIDFFATVLALTGLSSPFSHFGVSLLPWMLQDTPIRRFVHCEGGRLREEQHCREAEGRGAKNPLDLYWPRVGLQQENGDPMYHTKATMIRSDRYKYVRRLYEMDEFYDLREDPDERVNEINNPIYQDMISFMRDKMLTFYQETCDVVPYLSDER